MDTSTGKCLKEEKLSDWKRGDKAIYDTLETIAEIDREKDQIIFEHMKSLAIRQTLLAVAVAIEAVILLIIVL